MNDDDDDDKASVYDAVIVTIAKVFDE